MLCIFVDPFLSWSFSFYDLQGWAPFLFYVLDFLVCELLCYESLMLLMLKMFFFTYSTHWVMPIHVNCQLGFFLECKTTMITFIWICTFVFFVFMVLLNMFCQIVWVYKLVFANFTFNVRFSTIRSITLCRSRLGYNFPLSPFLCVTSADFKTTTIEKNCEG